MYKAIVIIEKLKNENNYKATAKLRKYMPIDICDNILKFENIYHMIPIDYENNIYLFIFFLLKQYFKIVIIKFI